PIEIATHLLGTAETVQHQLEPPRGLLLSVLCMATLIHSFTSPCNGTESTLATFSNAIRSPKGRRRARNGHGKGKHGKALARARVSALRSNACSAETVKN